jgi:hypothetical protein
MKRKALGIVSIAIGVALAAFAAVSNLRDGGSPGGPAAQGRRGWQRFRAATSPASTTRVIPNRFCAGRP